MTQPVKSPPEQPEQHISPRPAAKPRLPATHTGLFVFLALLGLLLIVFTGLLIGSLAQGTQGAGTQNEQGNRSSTQTNTNSVPLLVPGSTTATPLQLPAGSLVAFEQQDNHIYLTSTNSAPNDTPQALTLPGYLYNRAVPPLTTPQNELIYSGDGGIWQFKLPQGPAQQIATFPTDQVITSLALSRDGSMLAWSTAPKSGSGSVRLYAGPLNEAPGKNALLYQQPAGNCPCFRVFSFLHDASKQADTTLLLTDDRGDHRAVRYGLWTFDLSQGHSAQPQPLLEEGAQQGPLALAPTEDTLLYSSYEGVVPAPTDGSAPQDIESSYANNLTLASLGGTPLTLSNPQVIVPAQRELSNSAEYHWVTTPLFSPDGHTLVYVEFSSDSLSPFGRHSALYTVQISGTGAHLQASKPHLLATSTALFTEFGPWLDDHTLTFYADKALYAIDIQSAAAAKIASTQNYARVIAIAPRVATASQNPRLIALLLTLPTR